MRVSARTWRRSGKGNFPSFMLALLFMLLSMSPFRALADEDSEMEDVGDDDGGMEEGMEEDGEEPEDDEDGSAGEGMEGLEATAEQFKAVLTKADKNSDGKISVAEMSDFAEFQRQKVSKDETKAHLEEWDKNKDGKIDEAESLVAWNPEDQDDEDEDEEMKALAAREREFEKKKFKAADADKDGFLNPEELTGMLFPDSHEDVLKVEAEHHMSSRDINKDGRLSREEFVGDEDAEGESMPDMPAGEHEEFDHHDADKDGKLSIAEVASWISGKFYISKSINQIFEIADEDKDGDVSFEELEARHAELVDHEHLSQWVMLAQEEEEL